jgi:hypothetical protein
MLSVMDRSRLNVTQLQKRNPAAWTELLHANLQSDDLTVSTVKAEPLRNYTPGGDPYHVVRYVLTLAGHSDPISLIAKRTNSVEASFYQHIAPQMPLLAARCLFTSQSEDQGWVVLDDVPSHFPPEHWTLLDVEEMIQGLTGLHAFFWNQPERITTNGIPHFIGQRKYSWEELKEEQEIYFEEGPGAVISQHAVNNAGRLAGTLLQAANGLTVIRDLGGWPGILGESHLAAAADLLDDPVPMLEPLRELPVTLVHGNPRGDHWHLTLFDELRLIDWQHAVAGPGIMDLVSFLEQFDLLRGDTPWQVRMRPRRPTSDETIIDTYFLSMTDRLGSQFNARLIRQAIPAARCLYVLTTWFPYFATWFADMPNKYTWQKVNRMRDDQLLDTAFQSIVGYRPVLAAAFKRFLHAYRTL